MSTKEPTLTEFRTMFPELTATDHTDAAVTLAIELAEHFHSRSKVGWLLAAAHLVTDEGQLALPTHHPQDPNTPNTCLLYTSDAADE